MRQADREINRNRDQHRWPAGRMLFVLAAMIGITASIRIAAQTPPESTDKYLWLEDVSGERPMAWVRAENERSAKVLESDPHYAELEAAALKALESPDRLPTPSLNGDDVYNVWQDAE